MKDVQLTSIQCKCLEQLLLMKNVKLTSIQRQCLEQLSLDPISTSEVARRLGIPRKTASYDLIELKRLGLICDGKKNHDIHEWIRKSELRLALEITIEIIIIAFNEKCGRDQVLGEMTEIIKELAEN